MNELLDRSVDRINSKRLERYGASGFKAVTDAEREEFEWLLDEGLKEAYERNPAGPAHDAHFLFGELLGLCSNVDGMTEVLSRGPRFFAMLLFTLPKPVRDKAMSLMFSATRELIDELIADNSGQIAKIRASFNERMSQVKADCSAVRDTLRFK